MEDDITFLPLEQEIIKTEEEYMNKLQEIHLAVHSESK